MAPLTYGTSSHLGSRTARRAASNDCSGFNCLSDATQLGIIFVVVATVFTLGYLYWRFKVKPNLPKHENDERPVIGYWEVTRRDPSRVSITIYREPRPPSDEEPSDEEPSDEEASVPDAPKSILKKGGNEPTRTGKITTDQAPNHPLYASAPDIHLVPPPPPAVFWANAGPSTYPPPPPFGPPVVLAPGPSPAPLQPGTLGFGTAAVPYPPDVPPPYFGYPAPQNTHVQYPNPVNVATAQPIPTAQPARSPAHPRNNHNQPSQATPAVGNQSHWRRWFSLGTRSPTVGHARTLSDSSSAGTRSRSPSPPPPSVSPPSPVHKRDRSRRPPAGQPRSSPADRRQTRDTRQRRTQTPPQSESSCSCSSSYINTSVEAVFDSQDRLPHSRQQAYESRGPERRTRRPSGRTTDLTSSSDIIPLSNLRHHRRPSSPSPRRRQPSPDLQFLSPEPRRARVSFELPRESDVVSTCSCSSPSPEHPERSSRRSPTRSRQSPMRSRRSESEGYDDTRHRRRRGQPRRGREEPSLPEQIIDTFYRMRRALRGED